MQASLMVLPRLTRSTKLWLLLKLVLASKQPATQISPQPSRTPITSLTESTDKAQAIYPQ